MKKAFIIITLIVSVYACKDVVNEVPDVPFGTTAYTFTTHNNVVLPPLRIPKDNALTKEGVQLGRMLFYDPILSADSTQSCSSCHNQSDGFTDNGLAFSEGIRGDIGKRNAMPIFNLMWHLDGFFWDNRADILRHQALMPIQDPSEMDETLGNLVVKLNNSPLYKEHFEKAFDATSIDEELIGKALEQFMNSIVSGNSKFDRVQLGLETFTSQEKVGQIIFNAEAIRFKDEINPNDPKNFGGDCFHCHGGSLFMRRESLTNCLPSNDDLGKGGFNGNTDDNFKFKTPSLRNIEKTAPYMHDGRFNTLEEVVQFYLSDLNEDCPVDVANAPNMHALKDSVYLSEDHKAALVSFLKTLTDDTYLTNEEYSNPF
ncbi:MAG: cytochrome-c peroxidase [Bacteroidetes bacterium]|nr:MAG: cytochrome-c peroxidase [Bacteroidota bacterium]